MPLHAKAGNTNMAIRTEPRLQPNRRLTKSRTAPQPEFVAENVAIPSQRVRSLDALRGFDMFWIIGGDAVATCLARLSPNETTNGVLSQFAEHSSWEGLQCYDVVFPLFIVIMGVALTHSIGNRIDSLEKRKAVLLKIFRRTVLLFLLGLVYNGFFLFEGFDHLRLFGVLQRLSLVYGITSLLMVFTSRKTQGIVGASLLLLYWGLMRWIPVPGFHLGDLSPDGNAANYLDRLLLMPHQMYTTLGDPEGLLSTIPAVSTCLLGVFAGYWLRSSRPDVRKVVGLGVAGVACIALGLM